MAKVKGRGLRKAKVLARPRSRPTGSRRGASQGEERPKAKGGEGAGSPGTLLLGELERLHTELAAARDMLATLEAKANVDPLLDVYNRRGFERELKRSLAYVQRYGTRAALVYIDLDGFKPVNDTHGHAAGDTVLKTVAQMLVHHVRASDTVARIGGDEFVVLLWNVDEDEAAAKAAALEQMIASTRIDFGVNKISVAASAGYTVLEPLDEATAVLTRADQAMYRRKAARRFDRIQESPAAHEPQPAARPKRNALRSKLTKGSFSRKPGLRARRK